MLPGLDHLGGPQYIRTAALSYPAGWAIGCFWDFFGDGKKFCDAMYTAGCRIFRIQGTWDKNHDYGSGYQKLTRRNAQEVEAWAKAHPDATVYYSIFCEHAHKRRVTAPIFADIRKNTKRIILVNSILYTAARRGEEVPGVITEVHNSAPVPRNKEYIYSSDGEDSNERNITELKRKHASAKIFFFWNSRFNGKFEADDEAKPVHLRNGWPNRTHIQSIQYLATEIGEVSKLPQLYLSKSHAENDGKGDAKAEKYCLIIPAKFSSFDLFDIGRKKVATMRRFDPPRVSRPWNSRDKGYRYYSTDWGFEISEAARLRTGSPVVTFDVGKKRFRVNPAFRTGFY